MIDSERKTMKSDLTKEIESYCRKPKIPDTDLGKLRQEMDAVWKFLWCLSMQTDTEREKEGKR